MRVKMSKQPPPAPTASAVGPCPTIIQIVGRPGTGSLLSTIAPSRMCLEQGRQLFLFELSANDLFPYSKPCPGHNS